MTDNFIILKTTIRFESIIYHEGLRLALETVYADSDICRKYESYIVRVNSVFDPWATPLIIKSFGNKNAAELFMLECMEYPSFIILKYQSNQ